MISGQIITANRLSDGVVVFFDPRNRWVERLAAGGVWTDTVSANEALALARQDEARDVVVEAYLIDVVDKNGAVAAKHLREAIRAAGPTIRRDLGKQAETAAV
jgi:predicted nucleic acid-binding protein